MAIDPKRWRSGGKVLRGIAGLALLAIPGTPPSGAADVSEVESLHQLIRGLDVSHGIEDFLDEAAEHVVRLAGASQVEIYFNLSSAGLSMKASASAPDPRGPRRNPGGSLALARRCQEDREPVSDSTAYCEPLPNTGEVIGVLVVERNWGPPGPARATRAYLKSVAGLIAAKTVQSRFILDLRKLRSREANSW